MERERGQGLDSFPARQHAWALEAAQPDMQSYRVVCCMHASRSPSHPDSFEVDVHLGTRKPESPSVSIT
jgi:hypothetical protein